MTALALEIAKQFLAAGHGVLYLDFSQSIIEHRLAGLECARLIVARCVNRQELLDVCSAVSHTVRLIVVDRLSMVREDWGDNAHGVLRTELGLICPEATQVFCDLPGKGTLVGWDMNLGLDNHRNHWVDGELIGHEIDVRGPRGMCTVFISHYTGQVHWAYTACVLQKEEGTHSSSYFTVGGQKIKGFWMAVEQTVQEATNENGT
jgi:hypothetical protein